MFTSPLPTSGRTRRIIDGDMRLNSLPLSLLLVAVAAGASAAQPCRGPAPRPSGNKPAAGTVEGLSITPNPWRSDRSGNPLITFKAATGLRYVMLFTTSGRWVRTLHCLCAELERRWDLLNDAGQPVKSGIYVYLIRDVDGRQSRGTLAVLR